MARSKPLEKIDWQSVEESSNIEAMFFDEYSHTIAVRFKHGGVYTYMGADRELYLNFLHAPSVGKYLHNVIKALPYTRWDTEKELIHHLNV
jgi:hypothetical protein